VLALNSSEKRKEEKLTNKILPWVGLTKMTIESARLHVNSAVVGPDIAFDFPYTLIHGKFAPYVPLNYFFSWSKSI